LLQPSSTDCNFMSQLTVAISGIDASGKGYVAAQLASRLRGLGFSVAVVGVDGWLNLPSVRFNSKTPGEHFYLHALRLNEMFERLILPLKVKRSVTVEMDYVEETASAYRRHRYDFQDVEIDLVDGIFLLKRAYFSHFHLSCWVDCTFETALERAIRRGQEGLDPAETKRAFEFIYFPAQRIHFQRDAPQSRANLSVENDPRLSPEHSVALPLILAHNIGHKSAF
jgi:uridine kinase